MDIPTREGAKKGGERGRTKAAVKVGHEASGRERLEKLRRERCGVGERGMGGEGGTEDPHHAVGYDLLAGYSLSIMDDSKTIKKKNE